MTTLLLIAVAVGFGSGVLRGYSTESFVMREPLIDGALAYSVLVVGYLVFTPQVPTLEPFRPDIGNDVSQALAAAPGDSQPWLQLAGNLVLLLPLSVLVPQRLPWFDNLAKIALGGLLCSAAIEAIQFVAISGRVCSTDDIVCNTVGATLGGMLVRLPYWISPANRPQHRTTGEGDPTVWLLIARIEHERQCYQAAAQSRRSLPRRRPVVPQQPVFSKRPALAGPEVFHHAPLARPPMNRQPQRPPLVGQQRTR
ncbi:VanZ family protein [Saccharopolyspora mangrovi]|uniref:VanZ family protein n=1 Tax=Saccharopolyspora mangrovi TaxID=3082379 RepID=A0ABU6A331_9PSEU|nr:VanZ family protein [Saccharopolyspora sp. S2-29]MEB3365871.1 VanZ family protein [Saccharopolyspora sp. S2-29]